MSVENCIPTLPILKTREAEISWVAYHPIDLTQPPSLTPEEEAPIIRFWTTTVLSLDNALQDEKNEETNSVLIRFSEEKASYSRKRKEVIVRVSRYLRDNPDAIYLAMANGSLPDMMDVWRRVDVADIHARMHSVIVGGSDGASIKQTVLKSKLPEVGTPDNPIVIDDDVGDTMAAIAALLEAIEAKRSGQPVNSTLSEKLAGSFGKNFFYYRGDYLELVHRLHEQNIMVAMNAYKNKEFYDELSLACENFLIKSPLDGWAKQQQLFLKSVVQKPAHEWLMGMNMDTKINGSDIISSLDPDLLTHPKTKALIEHLKTSALRVGSTIDTLVALQPRDDVEQKYAIGELIAWAGKEINRKLRNLANT